MVKPSVASTDISTSLYAQTSKMAFGCLMVYGPTAISPNPSSLHGPGSGPGMLLRIEQLWATRPLSSGFLLPSKRETVLRRLWKTLGQRVWTQLPRLGIGGRGARTGNVAFDGIGDEDAVGEGRGGGEEDGAWGRACTAMLWSRRTVGRMFAHIVSKSGCVRLMVQKKVGVLNNIPSTSEVMKTSVERSDRESRSCAMRTHLSRNLAASYIL